MSHHFRYRLGGFAVAVLLAGLGLAATATAANTQPASARSVTLFAGVFHPIRSVANFMCLQPAGGSTALFAAIVQEACVPGSVAQGWEFKDLGDNHYQFVSQVSGLCMYANGAFNFATVTQEECKRVSNNEWNTNVTLPEVVSLESRIGFRNTRRCIDVDGGGSTDPGLPMILFGCNGATYQRWVVGFD
jgi:hypothetical protein